MRCPFCKGPDSAVIDGRPKDDGAVFRRRRKCLDCSRRWTTYERIFEGIPKVKYRDGKVEAFDGTVLFNRLTRHCAKLPVQESDQALAADRLLDRLCGKNGLLSTEVIAGVMMETLLELHPMASLRFELEWRRPQDAADMLQIVWEFADRNGILQKQKVTHASTRRRTVRK